MDNEDGGEPTYCISDDVLRDWKGRVEHMALRLRHLSDWAEGRMRKPLIDTAVMCDHLAADIETERRQ